jgi:hypothetical protein
MKQSRAVGRAGLLASYIGETWYEFTQVQKYLDILFFVLSSIIQVYYKFNGIQSFEYGSRANFRNE